LSAFRSQPIFPAVKSPKTLFAAIAFAASTIGASAQIDLRFSTNRSYRQLPDRSQFLQGDLTVGISDGSASYGCTAPFFFGPSLPCPLGATGFVTTSAFLIPAPYFEITSINPAAALEPFRPQDVKLYSAPPSKLPRNLSFNDAGIIVWYNLQTNNIQQYRITNYSLTRNYATRNAMDSEVVPGVYQFVAPALNNSTIGPPPTSFPAVGLSVTHTVIPEGWAKISNVAQGFRFTNLRLSPDGYAELDPRLPQSIRWQGNTQDKIYMASDSLYFSMLVPEIDGDPLSPIAIDPETGGEAVAFPFFTAGGQRIRLQTPLDAFYTLPPGFLPPPTDPTRPFAFGRELIVRVTLQRNLRTTAVSSDVSRRDFELPVRFVDTFEGFIAQFFNGAGFSPADRLPGADPDGDGFTNFEEWVNGTNPTVADQPAPAESMVFNAAPRSRSTPGGNDGYWSLSFPKLEGHTSALSYKVEYSEDMKTWGAPNPAVWNTVVHPNKIEVRSQTATINPKGFFRVKATQTTP
jgi:hypothetical protein